MLAGGSSKRRRCVTLLAGGSSKEKGTLLAGGSSKGRGYPAGWCLVEVGGRDADRAILDSYAAILASSVADSGFPHCDSADINAAALGNQPVRP